MYFLWFLIIYPTYSVKQYNINMIKLLLLCFIFIYLFIRLTESSHNLS